MKIAYIAAGAGTMYCGSCIHDNALVTAIKAQGHDAILLPIYTPLRTDEVSTASDRVFYGAINVFLEQRLPLLRHLPGFVHRWLDRPSLLRRISTSTSTTDAKLLGGLTLSMLQGEDGRQTRELTELAEWLDEHFRPDIVHLAHSMLLGLAPTLKRHLNVPIVCSVQGEDIFLEELTDDWKSRVIEVLRRQARDIDQFVATSEYYSEFMKDYLEVESERMTVAPIGITVAGHRPLDEPIAARREAPLVLGFLARICPEKGLHLLVEAFRLLSEELGPGAVRLRIAGYLGGRDLAYLEEQRRRLTEWGLIEFVEILAEVDRHQKLEFLRSLDILSVPTTYVEPKGLFVLEANANGVPVVQPNHGAFPEVLGRTGGGLLVEPNSPQALADGIAELWRDPDRRQEMGQRSRQVVHDEYDADSMADATLAIYDSLVSR